MTSHTAQFSEGFAPAPERPRDAQLLARLDAIIDQMHQLREEASRGGVTVPPLAETLSLEERIHAVRKALQPTVEAFAGFRPTVCLDRNPVTGALVLSLSVHVGMTPPDAAPEGGARPIPS